MPTSGPSLEPDPGTMRRHLDHLFGGDLDGLHDGLVELAWSDPGTGDLRHAELFATDRLDRLVETALRHNRVAGRNVYLGQALRRPDAPPSGRCGDAHFLALTACYADLDDDVVAQAREAYRARGCPPTAVVVTGRRPHVRAQLLWRLETPERDPDQGRRQNLTLALALGGDRGVVNPGRVLRLAGSLAWPVKPGRVLERTELQTFADGRPRVYLPGQLARAFPRQAGRARRPAPRRAWTPAAPWTTTCCWAACPSRPAWPRYAAATAGTTTWSG
ncbi:MAG TPA: hypothetical protein VFY87_07195 [Geminicoccaceae bacterium]|nr:hypothetical protein [Geminicoccaceae bacterium]